MFAVCVKCESVCMSDCIYTCLLILKLFVFCSALFSVLLPTTPLPLHHVMLKYLNILSYCKTVESMFAVLEAEYWHQSLQQTSSKDSMPESIQTMDL